MSEVHPLKKYLDAEGMTQLQLALKADVPAPRISEVLRGRRPFFSRRMARRIEAATDKALSFAVLVEPWPPESAGAPHRKTAASRAQSGRAAPLPRRDASPSRVSRGGVR